MDKQAPETKKRIRPAGFNRGKYCQVCYESVDKCDNCNEPLGKIGWCSDDGKHYCNEDCQPQLTEAIFNEEKK